MYIVGRGGPQNPHAFNHDAHSTAHAETASPEEKAAIEKAEKELFEAHQRDRERRAEYDRQAAIGTASANLKKMKERISFDPIFLELFEQVAALRAEIERLKGSKAASDHFDVRTFPFFAAKRVDDLIAAPVVPFAPPPPVRLGPPVEGCVHV